MSRGFGTTRGVGASDVINTGASLVFPVQKLAGFAFVSRNGPGGGGYGRIVDFAASDLAFYIDNTSSELVFQHTFSTTGGIWRGPIPANAAWRSVGFTYDQSSVANIPALYVDGAPIAVTTTTAPVGTATGNNGLMRIGNRQVGDRNFDGDIARVAVWRGTLPTAAEFAAMTAGTVPSSIQAATLVYYASLSTGTTAEVGSTTSVTGTAARADPTFGGGTATALTLTGPTTGTVGAASSNFTVAANGSLSANVTVTPSAGAGGGTFNPATLTLTNAATSGTFTYTAASAGAKTISVTNSGSLTNPSAVTFTASAAGDTTPPTLTGAITIGTVTSTSIAMSWPAGADNVAVTSYEVSKDSGATWIDTSGTGLSYIFTGLAASTSYGLRVRAKDAAGNVSTPALAATQSTSAAGGATLTSSALKNNTGALHLSAAFEAFVLNATTGALIVRKTGLTSHASTGVVTFNDAALTAATQYRVVWRRTDTGAQGLELLTAA